VSGVVVRLRTVVVRSTYAVARLLPLRRHVVLATAHDPAPRGDLRVIRDALRAADPPIRVVVLAHRASGGWRGRIGALWADAVAGYHLATAALFIVDDYFFPIYVIRRRPGTTIVQTWHACGAIKKIGYSVADKSFGANEALTRRVKIHTNYDICLAGSQAAVVQYMDAFRQPAELFVTDLGIPRTDVLVDDRRRAGLVEAIRARYAIPAGKRVILYAPTFRGSSIVRAVAGPMLDLAHMHERLGDDHVVLLRLHPFIRARSAIDPALTGFAIDVSDYPEVNEIMLVSDVLVTDYSSVIFEFALLGRPMAFFAPDTDAYEQERGFYFDYRSGVPGPVFETTEALTAYLRAGEYDPERVRRFAATWFDVADGHATKRFVDRIVRPTLAGERVRRTGR
jgi:CDP-ribitol ribitolphosphotransferase